LRDGGTLDFLRRGRLCLVGTERLLRDNKCGRLCFRRKK
jgi:hypothetical protein